MIFALLPINFYLATVTLSEPIFCFFLISSLVLLSPERTFRYYLLGIFMFTIATGIRYESWFLLPFIWCLILIKDLPVFKKIVLILGSGLFINFWIFLNSFYLHDPFFFF